MIKRLFAIVISFLGVYSIEVHAQLNQNDYQKALWMSTRFYGANRSGEHNWLIQDHLPSGVSGSLEGKSFLQDADGGHDLSGGWFDCGDHVKFGQTQFYAGYMLLKAYDEFQAGFDDHYSSDYTGYNSAGDYSWEGDQGQSNGIPDVLDEVKHATDYFIKCARSSSQFYFEVGHGDWDHQRWETSVKMQTNSVNQGGEPRPNWDNPNDGAMPSFCAATLALMSRKFRPFDEAYADLCLQHAQYAYSYASNHIGQSQGAASGSFYGGNDNAMNAWAICLAEMYWATGTNSYRSTAYGLSVGNGSGSDQVEPNQYYTFDYGNNGELALYVMWQLGHSSAASAFDSRMTNHWLSNGNYNGEGIYSSGGGWGKMRYVANAGFLVALWDKFKGHSSLDSKVFGNVDYLLGDNSDSQSFIVGFYPSTGGDAPTHPHHRNVYLRDDNPGNADNSLTIPTRNSQFGALVGGSLNPSQYSDIRNDYVNTEVCIDYNAGLVGALAAVNHFNYPIDTTKFFSQCSAPDLGADQSLCGTSTISLNTGLGTQSGRTFEWFRNGTSVAGPSASLTTYDVSQGGTWMVTVDSSGECQRSSSVAISATLPSIDLGPDVELCDPSTVDLDAGVSGNGITYNWERNNTSISSDQGITVSEAGTYDITISASGCASQSDQITITSLLPEAQNDTICASGTATLEVTSAGGPYDWYANATGGGILETGTTYSPSISTTTTYYVVDGGSFGGTVGPSSYPGSTQNWGVNSGNHLNFTASSNFTIDALKVSYGNIYSSQSNATISIEVLDENGNSFNPQRVFTSNPTNVDNGMSNSLVRFEFSGFDILQSWGPNLRLRVDGHTNVGDLNWASSGSSFPYQSNPSGIVTITGTNGGNNDNNDYMYFYDWEISSGVSCARKPVTAVLDPGGNCGNVCTPPLQANLTPGGTQNICTGEDVDFTASVSNGYLYRWYRNGTPVGAAAVDDNAFTATQAGTYTVRIGDGDVDDSQCYLESSGVTVNINSAPTANITTTSLEYCEGTLGLVLDAQSVSGAMYEWFNNGSSQGAPSANSSYTGATNGNWTVEVSKDGCSALSSAVNVTEISLPSASINTTGTDLEYCQGTGGVTLAAQVVSGATYEWFFNGSSQGSPSSSSTFNSAMAGNWTVEVDVNGCTDLSAAVTVIENSSPSAVVTTTGQDLSYCNGVNGVTLSAQAVSGATYQWFLGGTSQGAASASTDFLNATSGSWTVEVSANGCTEVSSAVTVFETTVIAQIETSGPGLEFCPSTASGATLTATTVVGGAYQWYRNGSILGGETNSTLVDADAATYYVEVSSNVCIETSTDVTVTENCPACNPPQSVVIQEGASVQLCSGEVIQLTTNAQASATDFELTWYRGAYPGGSVEAGPTLASSLDISVSSNDADWYYVEVRDANMPSDQSCVSLDSIEITQGASPSASIITTSLEYCQGDPGVTLDAQDAGVGASYTWFDGGTQVGTGIQLNNATQGSYSVLVDLNGCSATSNLVTVVENSGPTAQITTSGSDLVYCIGTQNGVTLEAETGGAGYDWYLNGGFISTTSIPQLDNALAGLYTVEVTDGTCSSTSSSAEVIENCTACAPPLSLSISNGSTVDECEGNSLALTGTYTLDTPSDQYYYEWFKDGSSLGAANTTYSDLTLPGLGSSDEADYTLRIEDGTTGSPACYQEASVTLNVDSSPSINQDPFDASVCEGETHTFDPATTNANSFQWEFNGVPISGETGESITLVNIGASDEGAYQLVATGVCGEVTSAPANLTVGSLPVVSQDPVSQEACLGGNVTFTAGGSVGSTYQWYGPQGVLTGETSPSLTLSSLTASDFGDYHVELSSTCGVISSAVATLSSGGGASITAQPSSQSVCEGTNMGLSVTAVGNGLSYQWSKDGASLTGETSSTFQEIASLSSAGTYSVAVTSSCGITTSDDAVITVEAIPQILSDPIGASHCTGEVFSISSTASGADSYQWYKNGLLLSGENTTSLSLSNLQLNDAGSYTIEAVNACGSVFSQAAALLVVSGPGITQEPVGGTICEGSSYQLSAIASGSTPSYQWFKDGTQVQGGTSSSLDLSNINVGDAGSYYVEVSSSCGLATSNAASLNVSPLPNAPGTILGTTSICPNTTGETYTVPTDPTISSFQWSTTGDAFIVSGNGSTSTIVNFGLTTSTITVESFNACGSGGTSDLSVGISGSASSSVTVVQSGSDVCTGGTLALSAVPNNGGSSPIYQWYVDGSPSGSNSNGFNLPGATSGTVVTVEMISSASCADGEMSSSPAFTVSTQSPPTIDAIIGDETVCLTDGQEYDYEVELNSGSIYNWGVAGQGTFSGQGNNTITVTYQAGASVALITVTELSSGGCASNTASVQIDFDCGVGLDEVEKISGVEAYPNPFSNSIVLDAVASGEAFEYRLVHVSGLVVDYGTLGSDVQELNVDGWPSGTYILELENNEQVMRKILVKTD